MVDIQPLKGFDLSAVAHLRQQFPLMGIIVIDDKKREENHIRALQYGADHFLPRPLSLSLLTATISALFRRLHVRMDALEERPNVWKFNRHSQVLSGSSSIQIQFSDRESAILTTLFLSPHFPVSSERLLHALNMTTEIFDPHRIDTIIYRIRKKLRQNHVNSFEIRNFYGQGYLCIRLEEDASFYVWDGH